MLLCVILVWPTEFENSLNLCKMCLKLENLRRIVWKSYFWETGFKISVFENHSSHTHAFYSQNTMLWRVFAQNCFVFQKNWFFLNFDQSNLFLNRLKLLLKFLALPCVFWSIEPIFQSVESRIESFSKNFVPYVFITIQTFSKHVLSLFDRSKTQDFFCFPPKFLQGFCPLRPVRPFYPSFCIYFHVSCIKSCILGKISNQWIFGIFFYSSCFS